MGNSARQVVAPVRSSERLSLGHLRELDIRPLGRLEPHVNCLLRSQGGRLRESFLRICRTALRPSLVFGN